MCADSTEMSEGTNSDAKMAGLLAEELKALQRQRDQYALAMDAATDPKVAIRLQRTLERIEDEIEGLEESLQALPRPTEPVEPAEPDPPPAAPPPAAPSEPSPPEAEVEPPAPEVPADVSMDGPDWDDEPSTAIYDPDHVREQLEALEAPEPPASAEPAGPTFASMEPEPEPEPDPEPEPEPRQIRPSATIPPVAVAPAETPAAMAPEAPEPPAPEPDDGNPLGPVWMDGLSPSTGKVPLREVEKAPPEPVAADPDALGDDPFAMPARPAAVEADSSSPFGAPAVAPADFANPVSVLEDDVESAGWGWGAKLTLMVVVGAFLAGVFYIMSIG